MALKVPNVVRDPLHVGTHIMRELMQFYPVSDHTALSPDLFSTGFDASNPAHTPSGLNTARTQEPS
ncbi:MAG: hypothetical protein CSA50_04415 [Gammaproteobacteria bacterium]|nr:MAG: hypothetical protein CSA50_04415 [Gammaproteobacteria bacterium]